MGATLARGSRASGPANDGSCTPWPLSRRGGSPAVGSVGRRSRVGAERTDAAAGRAAPRMRTRIARETPFLVTVAVKRLPSTSKFTSLVLSPPESSGATSVPSKNRAIVRALSGETVTGKSRVVDLTVAGEPTANSNPVASGRSRYAHSWLSLLTGFEGISKLGKVREPQLDRFTQEASRRRRPAAAMTRTTAQIGSVPVPESLWHPQPSGSPGAP